MPIRWTPSTERSGQMAYEVVVEHLNHLGIVAEVCREIGVALVRGHACHIVRILAYQVGVGVGECLGHLVGVFLVSAEDNGLGEAIGRLEVMGEVPSYRIGARPQ